MINKKIILDKLQKETFPIYLFHGVIEKPYDGVRNYTNKHMVIDDFEEIIFELKRNGNPISMGYITDCYNDKKRIPDYSYAITFDDGFENNYSLAAPILEKYGTPGTFYVSTNLIDNNYMTWIDRIEYCIDLASNIDIYLPWNNHPIKLVDTKSKINCLNEIRENVKINPNKFNPERIVDMIFLQCSQEPIYSNDHYLDQKMNWNQINLLYQNPLFEVGGHSHNHTSLGSLSSIELKIEVEKSINLFREKLGISLTHYSYPEGQENDFSDMVIDLLKSYGIICCPTAIDGVNSDSTEPFHLKRIML